MKKMFNEGNQIPNLISSSGSGTVINYGSGSDFLTSHGSGYGSGSTSQKVTVPTVPVPVPQHWFFVGILKLNAGSRSASNSQRHGSADPDPHQMSWIRNTALDQTVLKLTNVVKVNFENEKPKLYVTFLAHF
jgi:hypothetical protein